jgi:hypothetical protein
MQQLLERERLCHAAERLAGAVFERELVVAGAVRRRSRAHAALRSLGGERKGRRVLGVADAADHHRAVHVTPEPAPAQVCMVRTDRTEKLPLYARHGVRHAWVIDAIAQTLEVLRLEGDHWLIAQTFGGDATVRAEPFEAIDIDLTLLWGPRPTPADE